jgi:ectoine hydroxylase-related dioxygenase (phytanoyl-CoA dioxygenase family)
LFNDEDMRLVEAACDFKQTDAASAAQQIYTNVRFALGCSIDHPVFETLIRDSAMADLAQALFGGDEVWYENDQLWSKNGGATGSRRTAWHQDASYDPFAGSKTVVLWVPTNTRSAEHVLEVVRGSHCGPIYNGPRFDPDDDTAPTYEGSELPRIPDIQANRNGWDIFATAMNRGDALAFHHRSLHGGAPVPPGAVWRSMTFRFIGDDVLFTPIRRRRIADQTADYREQALAPGFESLQPGEPIHHAARFRRVRPWTAAIQQRGSPG